MELSLVDISPTVFAAWKKAFYSFPEVTIKQDNIINIAKNTIVSPANGYGYMDGGIDLAYRSFFGSKLEQKIRKAIAKNNENYLQVGKSFVLTTGNSRISYMIVAPTMILPEPIPPQNCFYAMLAILQAASINQSQITDIYCPGLGTGVGCVDPNDSAREMALPPLFC